DAADPVGREVADLRERGRVEGAGGDAGCAEALEPGAELAGRLVGEGDGEDLGGREGGRRDLVGDAARDRGRLAGARAGEDGDRAADGLGGAPLLGVQIVEDHLPTLEPRRDGRTAESVTEQWRKRDDRLNTREPRLSCLRWPRSSR